MGNRAALISARLRRLIDLDRLLSRGGRHSCHDLQERFGVSARTIMRDMEELRILGAPIPVQDPRGYCYTEPWQLSGVLKFVGV